MSKGPTRRGVVTSAMLCGLAPAFLLSGNRPSRSAVETVPADPTSGRSLVFEDAFKTLDATIWNRGPKATTFDPGFYGRSAFAREGGEAGYSPYDIVEDPEAENGSALQLGARYIGRLLGIPGYFGNDDPQTQWVSGNIQTATKEGVIIKGWQKGYFEARIKMPYHPLAWGAFWLMNGRSILFPKTSVEVDVVEHKGWERNLYGTYLHEWGQPNEHHEGGGVPTTVDLTSGYFRYGVLLDQGDCIPYFDRKPVLSPETGEPIRWTIGRQGELDEQGDVFWPLLTLALHSDVPYPADLTEDQLTTHMRVDYFRVYQ